jgi:hypothetical protein
VRKVTEKLVQIGVVQLAIELQGMGIVQGDIGEPRQRKSAAVVIFLSMIWSYFCFFAAPKIDVTCE